MCNKEQGYYQNTMYQEMKKQCGTCRYFLSSLRECNYPEGKLPSSVTKWTVDEECGEDCPTYKQVEKEKW